MVGAEWLAGLGGLAALISACFAVWAKTSQHKTSNIQQVYEAMKSHMATLAAENADLRQRQTNHGQQMHMMQMQVNELRIDVATCEADKARVHTELEQLRKSVSDG